MDNYESILNNFAFFSGIDVNAANELLNSVKYKTLRYPKGTQVLLKNDEQRNLFLLVEGMLKNELISPDGKVIRIRQLNAPEVIGLTFLFNQSNIFPFNLVAVSDVSILAFSKSALLSLLQSDTRLLNNFLSILSGKLTFLMQKIEFLNFHTISKKLAYYLLNLEYDHTNQVILPLSIQDLSDYFGVERPSLSKIIAEFCRGGLIEPIRRGHYIIKNRNGLLNIINHQ